MLSVDVGSQSATDLAVRESARVSVVILSHDSVDVIANTTQSVSQYLPAAEIVVLENGSTAQTLDAVRRLNLGARTIRLKSNLGFGAGCNVGAAAASREFLFMLNPDASILRVNPDDLRLSFARRPFGVVATTGKLPSGHNIPLARNDCGWRGYLALYLARCFIKPSWLSDRPVEALIARGGLWAEGAAMLVRRDEFLAVGGFDERLFLYHEDLDLCRRYRTAGYGIASSRGIIVRHAISAGSTVAAPYRIACALLSAIEMAEIWDRDGDAAARLVVRSLKVLETAPTTFAGRSIRSVTRKRAEARAVRRALLTVLTQRPAMQYPNARGSVRRALH